MKNKIHCDNLYASKKPTEVSWHQTHLEKSLDLIRATGVNESARLIDVGGGASTLVDDLLAAGFRHVTVLDISSTAIRNARARLQKQADEVTWLEADITRVELPAHHYDVWHDRAVFHFLTDPADRRRYLEAVNRAVKPGAT